MTILSKNKKHGSTSLSSSSSTSASSSSTSTQNAPVTIASSNSGQTNSSNGSSNETPPTSSAEVAKTTTTIVTIETDSATNGSTAQSSSHTTSASPADSAAHLTTTTTATVAASSPSMIASMASGTTIASSPKSLNASTSADSEQSPSIISSSMMRSPTSPVISSTSSSSSSTSSSSASSSSASSSSAASSASTSPSINTNDLMLLNIHQNQQHQNQHLDSVLSSSLSIKLKSADKSSESSTIILTEETKAKKPKKKKSEGSSDQNVSSSGGRVKAKKNKNKRKMKMQSNSSSHLSMPPHQRQRNNSVDMKQQQQQQQHTQSSSLVNSNLEAVAAAAAAAVNDSELLYSRAAQQSFQHSATGSDNEATDDSSDSDSDAYEQKINVNLSSISDDDDDANLIHHPHHHHLHLHHPHHHFGRAQNQMLDVYSTPFTSEPTAAASSSSSLSLLANSSNSSKHGTSKLNARSSVKLKKNRVKHKSKNPLKNESNSGICSSSSTVAALSTNILNSNLSLNCKPHKQKQKLLLNHNKSYQQQRDRDDFLNNSEDEYENRSTRRVDSSLKSIYNDSKQVTSSLGKSHHHHALKADTIEELEAKFCKLLKEKKGFIIKPMKEDGACLFRAVADQIYGDEEMHSTVRCNCMDYIAKNADYFKQYMTEEIDRYISRKRQETCYGNHIEIIAIAEIYNRPIEVYEYSIEPKNTFQSVFKTDNEPIRLSYHTRNHYNSVVNPFKATIGVGLGLPQLTPGLAEKNLMNEAIKKSEDFHIEQTMLDDKMKATDWEATNEEIMELVARESYLQWLKDNEKRNNFLDGGQNMLASNNASCSTWDTNEQCESNYGHTPQSYLSQSSSGNRRSLTSVTPPRSPSQTKFAHTRSSPNKSTESSKKQQNQPIVVDDPYSMPVASTSSSTGPSTSTKASSTFANSTMPCSSSSASGTKSTSESKGSSKEIYDENMPLAYQYFETKSLMNELSPDMFGLTGTDGWTEPSLTSDSDIVLASVLAASQQEYLESLKAKRQQNQ